MTDQEWEDLQRQVKELSDAGMPYDEALREVVSAKIKAASFRFVGMRLPNGQMVEAVYEKGGRS